MAVLAASFYHSAPSQRLTPPTTSDGKGGAWDFSRPPNHSRASPQTEPYMSGDGPSAFSPRHPHTSQANGFAKPVRSTHWDTQDQYYDNQQQNRAAGRVHELHRKQSSDMSNTNIDQDSVMEYYKKTTTNKKAPLAVKGKPRKNPTKAASVSETTQDENNWIHRDKLKEIETRELEEAGFNVRRGSRSNSRSQSATRNPRGRTNSESQEGGEDRSENRKVVSPIPAEGEDQPEQDQSWGSPRTEDDETELPQHTSRANHTIRPSTSRIPLPKTTGVTAPNDRDQAHTRSRTNSTTWSGEGAASNALRNRSASVGSQVFYDDMDDGRETSLLYGHQRSASSSGSGSSHPKSPAKPVAKAKTPGKGAAPTGARKASTTKAPLKNRTPSGPSPTKRPGTSSGSTSRPTTSHRPEGEAPWIATMYKPDPRLPPDQQIIPTHAKRMQQAQWENEGRFGSAYDMEFRHLNDEDISDKRLSQIQPGDEEKDGWPLLEPKQPSLPPKDDRDATKSPNSEQAGYRLTPTISHGPQAPSPKMAPTIAPVQEKTSTTRLPEPKEDEEGIKEKKSCCCIVM